jgi:hypothetical protein
LAVPGSDAESEEPVSSEAPSGESQRGPDANLVQPHDIGYVPVEERGGTISVSEGDAGPVGAIAVLASAGLRGAKLGRKEASTLFARAFGVPR